MWKGREASFLILITLNTVTKSYRLCTAEKEVIAKALEKEREKTEYEKKNWKRKSGFILQE